MMLSKWDVVLIVAVSVQATVLAYLPDPRWKAFLLSLPIPFTLAALSVGRLVDSSNLCGLLLLLLFTHLVRWLHWYTRLPIVSAIALSAITYCLLAIPLAKVVPRTEAGFWLTAGIVMTVGAAVLKCLPPRDEPQYRTTLPVWIKLPAIVGITLSLVLLKKHLGGFMTVFPMVGVVAAYEARHSLWTIGRQIPIVMLTMTPMMVTCHLTQKPLGMVAALGLSWMVFGLTLSCVMAALRSGHTMAAATAVAADG